MTQVRVTQNVAATADAAWNILKTGGNLHKWIPFIATCELEGEGAGAKRTCTTPDGKVLKETIRLVDSANRIFKYSIDEQDMMPLKNYVGTVSVRTANGGTEINWVAEFDLLDEAAGPAVEAGLTDLLTTAIAGLDALAKTKLTVS